MIEHFPYSAESAQKTDQALARLNKSINAVIHFEIADEIVYQRVNNRWVHLPSGREYDMEINPPQVAGVDDITGEPLSKRKDDSPELLE